MLPSHRITLGSHVSRSRQSWRRSGRRPNRNDWRRPGGEEASRQREEEGEEEEGEGRKLLHGARVRGNSKKCTATSTQNL